MKCTCETTFQPANAGPSDPYFPGIVRFGGERVTRYAEDCPQHGYMFHINLAAELRYGD